MPPFVGEKNALTLIIWRELTGLVPGKTQQNAKFLSCIISVLCKLMSVSLMLLLP